MAFSFHQLEPDPMEERVRVQGDSMNMEGVKSPDKRTSSVMDEGYTDERFCFSCRLKRR